MEEQKAANPEQPITDNTPLTPRPKAVIAIVVLVILTSVIFLLVSAMTEYFIFFTSPEPATEDLYLASWFALQGLLNLLKLPLAFFLLAMKDWARKALVIVCLIELSSLILVHIIPLAIPAISSQTYSTTAETIAELSITLLFIVFNDAIPLLVLTRRKIKEAFDLSHVKQAKVE